MSEKTQGSDTRVVIHEWLAEHEQQTAQVLREMTRCRSVQGQETQIQQLLAGHLERLGMEVDLWEPDGEALSSHPLFASPRTDFAGSPNLVGRLPGSGGGRSFLLNGHIDVVPVGDPEQWTQNPWGGELVEGRIYGRGASDMKGGVAASLMALQALQACGLRLAGDVIFESVMEEESGGAGTLAASLRGYRADAGLIPEPTGLAVFPKQQGSLWFRLTVHGHGAHGGSRYEGVSAIEKAMGVVAAVLELEKERNSRITDPLYAATPIPVPINLGVIRGGAWPSSVPDRVVLEGRMGVAPDETIENARAQMGKAISALGQEDDWLAKHPVELEWFGARWLPCSLDTESELVRALVEVVEEVRGESPAMVAAPWGTDAGLLGAAAGVPTVVFGPGIAATAHQPDEYVLLEDVTTAAEVIALMLLRWCGRG